MTTSWKHGASLYQGRRAIGGRIEVGRGRFEFVPHVLDRRTGGKPFTVDLRSITAVERTDRSWNPRTFSPRRCLLVTTSSGAEAKFLVNRLDELVDRLMATINESDAT
ncbi:hypothetical protein IFT73_01480 [Aeromicrobium sp. CFBP 8757]|uniref:hypothetical protein n=1 Tax=Aeromicrobium sp. CFBP 8757 TaxID=2775288 RepID=UPI0017863C57|nr:hypothetical protein [Aeromicrobium sp. CFBP 8757]MBD8605512.1 hypothetical protein [Aeromicrobium sp. CFBP 8757]